MTKFEEWHQDQEAKARQRQDDAMRARRQQRTRGPISRPQVSKQVEPVQPAQPDIESTPE